MKYKLIKKYPGIPNDINLGEILYKHPSGYAYNQSKLRLTNTLWDDNYFKTFPEFWYPINYQVKSTVFKKPYSPSNEELVNPTKELWDITKVLRLSDNQEFKIGDKINIIHMPTSAVYTIIRFEEIKDTIQLKVNYNYNEAYFDLDDIILLKEGRDFFYYINKSTMNKVEEIPVSNAINLNGNDIIVFKTKKEAEDYLFLNSKLLSLNDIQNLQFNRIYFENLVRERLVQIK